MSMNAKRGKKIMDNQREDSLPQELELSTWINFSLKI